MEKGTVDGGAGEIKARDVNFAGTSDWYDAQSGRAYIPSVFEFAMRRSVGSHVRIAAKADVFVGGDKDLLDVAHEVSGLTITDPRGFWNLAKKRPGK